MRPDPLLASARVLSPAGATAGTAFVVSPSRLVVTCSHVVQSPSDQDERLPRPERVQLEFSTGACRYAVVKAEYWRPWDREDVAILDLEDELPDGVVPVPLGPSTGAVGHRFLTYGHPDHSAASGQWAQGLIVGGAPRKGGLPDYLQLVESETIARGFSGGAVWDLSTGRVVGMVDSYPRPDDHGRLVGLTFATPSELLHKICDSLTLEQPCPYRPLMAFTRSDAALFHGRDRLKRQIMADVATKRFIAILGPSGSGKTSLIQAGLAPGLDADRFDVKLSRPRKSPLIDWERQGLDGASESLVGAVRRWSERHTHDRKRLVLVIDQFEEALLGPPEVEDPLFGAIEELLRAEFLPVTLVLVMWNAYYGRLCDRSPSLAPYMEAGTCNVPQIIESDEFEQIVTRPAEAVGLGVNPGLVAMLQESARETRPGGAQGRVPVTILPVLQLTLRELWEETRRQGRGELTAGGTFTGVATALSAAMDKACGELGPGRLHYVRRVLVDLIELGDKREGVSVSRRRRPIEDLCRSPEEREAIEDIVATLALGHILTVTLDDQGRSTVEIIHDVLIQKWEKFGEWLRDADRVLAWRKVHENTIKGWDEEGRNEDRLLRGDALARTENALRPDDLYLLTSLERAYLDRSRALQAAERHSRRRSQRRVAGLIALTGTAVAIAVYLGGKANESGKESGNRAREARYADSRTLAVLAMKTGAERPQQGLLLSLEAIKVNLRNHEPPSSDALRALRWALANAGGRVLAGHDEGPSVAVSRDGRWIATWTDSRVRLWKRTSQGSLSEPIDLRGAVGPARFSPNSSWLVTANVEGRPCVWSLHAQDAGAHCVELDEPPDRIDVMEISPWSKWLVIGTTKRNSVEFRVWDLRSEHPGVKFVALDIMEVHSHRGLFTPMITFSADNRWLVTSAWDTRANRAAPVTQPRLRRLDRDDPFSTPPVTLEGHTASVSHAVFSPDSQRLATCSNVYDSHFTSGDTMVRLWDLSRGEPTAPLHTLPGHEGPVGALAFSADGRWLVSGDGAYPGDAADRTVRIWDLNSNDPGSGHLTLSGHEDPISALVIGKAPDYNEAQWLAVLSGTRVRLWDFQALTNPNGVNPDRRQRISPTKSLVLSEERDGTPIDVRSIGVSSDNRWLATGCSDFTTRVWDLSAADPTGRPRILRGHEGVVRSVAFGPDSRWLATGSDDRMARLWSMVTEQAGASPLVVRGDKMAFSPDGRWLVTNNEDDHGVDTGFLSLWDLNASFLDAGHVILRFPGKYVYTLSISQDSHWLVASDHDRSAFLWDLTAPDKEPIRLTGHSGAIPSVAISGDSHRVATGSFDGTVRLWDLNRASRDRQVVSTLLEGPGDSIFDVEFSPDGLWLACVDSKGNLKVWNTGMPHAASWRLKGARPLAFGPTGRWLVTTGRATKYLWDLGSPDPPASCIDLSRHHGGVLVAAFHPAGDRLVTAGGDNKVRLWRLREDGLSLETTLPQAHGQAVRSVAFRPDGRRLVTGSSEQTLLWELYGGTVLDPPIPLGGDLEFIGDDGQFVVTSQPYDSQLRSFHPWDLDARDPSKPPSNVVPVYVSERHSVRLSPDGRWLVVAVRSGALRTMEIWNLRLDEMARLACLVAGRDLDPAEWNEHMPNREYSQTRHNIYKLFNFK